MNNVYRLIALFTFAAMVVGCEEPPVDPTTIPDIPAGDRSTSQESGGALPPKPE